METDKIFVSNSGAGMEKALKETERFAQYEKLSHKAGIHVRLLAEEMLGRPLSGNLLDLCVFQN